MDSNLSFIDLYYHPELDQPAAVWFESHWHNPAALYRASFAESRQNGQYVPHWFIICQDSQIIAGIGIIANDFHTQPELTPNLCALYVEKAYRNHGLAGQLLSRCCDYLKDRGYHNVYLITSHTHFYEKYGWTYYGMVKENSGHLIRMYQMKMD